jgi:hypothetical protein
MVKTVRDALQLGLKPARLAALLREHGGEVEEQKKLARRISARYHRARGALRKSGQTR